MGARGCRDRELRQDGLRGYAEGPDPPGHHILNVARGPAVPPSSQAQSCEAQQHHRPSRGFGNFSDDEREILVRPGPPRPFVDAGRRSEAAEGLAVVGRGVRQGAVGDVTLWYVKFVIRCAKAEEEADRVSAAATSNDGPSAPEIRWSSESIDGVVPLDWGERWRPSPYSPEGRV